MKTKTNRGRGNPNWVVIRLTKRDRGRLRNLLCRGQQNVRVVKRARILELMNEGKSAPFAASAVGVSAMTARSVAKRFLDGGLDNALFDGKRPGAKPKIGKKQEARITALVCSRPPDGFSRWTLRLIKQKIESHGIVNSISIECVRQLLKRHDLKPWREKNVVRA